LYLADDKYISKDPAAASEKAKRRILPVENSKDGRKKIVYDVSMALTLGVEAVAIDKLIGTYSNVKDAKDKIELFKKDNDLWVKNEVFGEGYRYIGNNTFEYPGEPDGSQGSLVFDLKLSGEIELTTKANWGTLDSPSMVYSKD
jgi:catechol 1,2-dioxygenase